MHAIQLNTDDIHDRIALRAQHNQCERFVRNVFYSQILRIRMYHALIHASRAMTLSEFVKLFERFDFIGILIEIALKSVFFRVILGWRCLFFSYFFPSLAHSHSSLSCLVSSQTCFWRFVHFFFCSVIPCSVWSSLWLFLHWIPHTVAIALDFICYFLTNTELVAFWLMPFIDDS